MSTPSPAVAIEGLVTLGDKLAEVAPLDAPAAPGPYSSADIADLREWLDGEITAAVDAAEADGLDSDLFPLRLPKGRMTAVLACPRKAKAELGGSIPPEHSLRGALADVAAVIAAMGPKRPVDFIELMQGVAAIEPDNEGLAMWRGLSLAEQKDLEVDLTPLGAHVQRVCAGVDPSWVIRPQFTAQASFAGGRVLSTARYDMLLSRPGDRSSAVVVEVKAGRNHSDHRADSFLYALLETLRRGTTPRAVITVSKGDTPVLSEAVTGGVLEAAGRRMLDAARVLIAMAAHPDRPPAETPGNHCGICPDRDGCPSASLVARATDGWDD